MSRGRFTRALRTFLGTALIAVSIPTMAASSSSNHVHNRWFSDLSEAEFKFLYIRIRRYLDSFRGQVETLDDAADGSGRLVGVAVNRGAFQNDPTYLNLVNEEFSYFTPENYAKWGLLQPNSPDEWDFTTLDAMVDSAEANKQLFKGHALVWHIQLPSFITEDTPAEEFRSLYQRHIQMTAGRYAGRIYSWDVANEVIETDGSYRNSIWLRKFGTDYIADAFYAAKAADPTAKLLYNDYAIARINPKSDGVYNMVKGLVEDGVPIDGVGFQMHLSAESAPSVDEIVENFERFTALGLTVNISELDVQIARLPWDFQTSLAIQQQIYHRVVDACLRVAGCEAVTTWGLTDRYTWIDGTFGPDDPLQFGEDFSRKPAYFGMIDGFIGLDSDPITAFPNLIANANVEAGLDGWSVDGGELRASKSRFVFGQRSQTGKRILEARNRSDESVGPEYDLSGLIAGNQSYDLSALGSITRGGRDYLSAVASLQCEGQEAEVVEITTERVRNRRWSRLEGTLTTPDCELVEASLKFNGPKARRTLYVDSVSLRPQVLVPAPRDDLGENLLSNGDFELGFDDWLPYAAGSAELESEDVYAGVGAGRAFDRTNGFDGISTELLGLVEPGKEYEFSSFVKLENAASDRVTGTLFAECSDGPQYLFITTGQASNDRWSYLAGTLTIPDCGATSLAFYLEGPQPGTNFFVDNASVREVIQEEPSGAVFDANFEIDTEGWYAFGPAPVLTTADYAYEGSRSLIVTGRTQTFEGPSYNITAGVLPGATYNLDSHVRVEGIDTTEVRATVVVECSDVDGPQYLGVASANATNTDWTQAAGSVTMPTCDITSAQIYFEGPAAGIDILLDAAVLTGATPVSSENLATNGDFEAADFAPWTATAGETLQLVNAPVFGGLRAISATNRTQTYEGPGIDLIGATQSEQSYAVTAQIQIAGAASADVGVTVRTVCEDTSESYLGAGTVTANDQGWVEYTGSVTMPTCAATLQRFYFEGPAAGIDIFVDEVSITQQ